MELIHTGNDLFDPIYELLFLTVLASISRQLKLSVYESLGIDSIDVTHHSRKVAFRCPIIRQR